MRKAPNERILTVARQHFLERGYDRTSTDLIASKARVSKQSIYDLHPTKAELFSAVMRNAAQAAQTDVRSIQSRGRAIEDVLLEYLTGFFADFVTSENRGLVRSLLMVQKRFPALATELHIDRLAGAEPLAAYLSASMEAGRIVAGDPGLLARRLGSTAVEGSRYVMAFAEPALDQQRQRITQIIAILLHGYAARQCDTPATVADQETEAQAPPARRKEFRLSPERVLALLDNAASEFLELGYMSASVERIIGASGISTATIYRHFGDKGGLFRSTIRNLKAENWDEQSPGPRHGRTLDEALNALARWTLERHLGPVSLALQRLLIIEAEQFPELARWADGQMRARPVRELRATLARFGAPAPDALAEGAFYSLATSGIRFLMEAEPPSEETRAALSKGCAALFLHGCAGRAP